MKFNKLIPELTVSDINISKHFYIDILGFTLEYERADEGFAFISLGEAQLMLDSMNGNWVTGIMEYPFGRGINFQIEVDNLDEISLKLHQNGIQPFKDTFISLYKCDDITYTEKELLVLDPDGYLLRFSETTEEFQTPT